MLFQADQAQQLTCITLENTENTRLYLAEDRQGVYWVDETLAPEMAKYWIELARRNKKFHVTSLAVREWFGPGGTDAAMAAPLYPRLESAAQVGKTLFINMSLTVFRRDYLFRAWHCPHTVRSIEPIARDEATVRFASAR